MGEATVFLMIQISVLEVAAYAIYVRGILRGEIVPSRASWLIWAPLLWLTAASTLEAGAGPVAVKTILTALGCTAVALLSIPYGTGGWSRSDRICVALACLGVGGWVLLHEPVFALACFILADAVGGVPTIRDVARDPSRERPAYWLLCSLTSLMALILVRPESWQISAEGFAEWAYPLYLLGINGSVLFVLTVAALRRSRPAGEAIDDGIVVVADPARD